MKIAIKKGLDLRVKGCVLDNDTKSIMPDEVAIYTDDFYGFTPKVEVKAGDVVKIGSPLLFDKFNNSIKLTSPVSGVVKEIVRGERRRIVSVVVSNDKSYSAVEFPIPGKSDAETLRHLLAESGLLAMIRQRPFSTIAGVDAVVRDIFVSAFDSSPLAYVEMYNKNQCELMEVAVSYLSSLTKGNIYICRRSGQMAADVAGAIMVDVKGKHPSGNVGVQIANIRPVNKGDIVWTMSADILMRIGLLLSTGKLDCRTCVAITGSKLIKPCLVETIIGAGIKDLVSQNIVLDKGHVRIISGNMLTGVKVDMDAYIHYPYTQITVMPEGDDVDEFMGWASMSPSKMSVNPSFPGRFSRAKFDPDARILGGRRAMIMSGLINKVLPMDVEGEYLIKAIVARDIDRMEQLGIYEVAPEDFALAECIDSSKMPLQEIIRQGIEFMRNE